MRRMELVFCMNWAGSCFLVTKYFVCTTSDCGADLLKAYHSPSPSSRCLLVHLALERCLQLLGVRPESKALSSLGYNQVLTCLYSF